MKYWPQNVMSDFGVYYGLKCCMNWENKKTTLQEEGLVRFTLRFVRMLASLAVIRVI
jgi:hypothetical protein